MCFGMELRGRSLTPAVCCLPKRSSSILVGALCSAFPSLATALLLAASTLMSASSYSVMSGRISCHVWMPPLLVGLLRAATGSGTEGLIAACATSTAGVDEAAATAVVSCNVEKTYLRWSMPLASASLIKPAIFVGAVSRNRLTNCGHKPLASTRKLNLT